MADVTTSSRPSQQQIIARIRNIRRDLDGIEKELGELYNLIGLSEPGGFLVNAGWRVAEGRMWLGRALAFLGEPNTSEDDDKASEARITVAPARREGTAKAVGETEEGGK